MNQTPEWNRRLKQAVETTEVPPYLEARVRHSLRNPGPVRSSWFAWVPAAATTAALFVGLGVAYQLGHLRFTAASQESYIVSVSNRVATLMRVGLGDHLHCALFRKFPKTAPTAEALVKEMGPQYSGLIPIVRRNVPDRYQMMLAHECSYHQRRFVHLSLMDGEHLLSVVIAKKGGGESFATEELLPALVESGIPIYQSGVQRFAINAFEGEKHLVYFVSDLPGEENNNMLRAMAPAMKNFLAML